MTVLTTRDGNRPLGFSQAHRGLLDTLARVANTDAERLIAGPSGVGKELYAHFVHQENARYQGPFVPINCGALPTELFENELFGHVIGAFSGARSRSNGLISEAEGGTLFLDVVDSLANLCQVKLLRFPQEKEYRRRGETHTQRVDVRIIAATNSDLDEEIHQGRFREDMFFRLRVFPVSVLPLCQRKADIYPLLTAFVQRYSREYNLPTGVFTENTLRCLTTGSWPGNICELENLVRCLTCLQPDRPVIPDDLPLPKSIEADTSDIPAPMELNERPLKEAKGELVIKFERNYLEQALTKAKGNISRAAQRSRKPRRVFFELMREYEIKAQEFRPVSLSLRHSPRKWCVICDRRSGNG